MKTYLTLITLLFSVSVVSAQQVIKAADITKKEKTVNKSTSNTNSKISMNVTTPRQTQGATFGEKVNAGLQSAGGSVANGATVQNPLYQSSGSSGVNPLFQSKNKTISPVGPIKGVIVKGSKGS